MKQYFIVTFEHAKGIYCTNVAHAETAEDVKRHYSEYAWSNVRPAFDYELPELRAKGCPFVEIEPPVAAVIAAVIGHEPSPEVVEAAEHLTALVERKHAEHPEIPRAKWWDALIAELESELDA